MLFIQLSEDTTVYGSFEINLIVAATFALNLRKLVFKRWLRCAGGVIFGVGFGNAIYPSFPPGSWVSFHVFDITGCVLGTHYI